MAARRRRGSRAYMNWVRSFRKRKRNPYPVAGLVTNSRRRRRHRKANPTRVHHRRRSSFGGGRGFFGLPPLQSVIYAGVGFVAPPIAEGFLNGILPLSLTSNVVGKYAVRVGTVLGLSFLAKSVLGKEQAKMIGIGGGAYVLISAIREFAPGLIPATSTTALAAYTRSSMGAYTSTRKTLGAPAFGATNTPNFAPAGGRNVVAARFRRFQ